jgi:hypothetical protein
LAIYASKIPKNKPALAGLFLNEALFMPLPLHVLPLAQATSPRLSGLVDPNHSMHTLA